MIDYCVLLCLWHIFCSICLIYLNLFCLVLILVIYLDLSRISPTVSMIFYVNIGGLYKSFRIGIIRRLERLCIIIWYCTALFRKYVSIEQAFKYEILINLQIDFPVDFFLFTVCFLNRRKNFIFNLVTLVYSGYIALHEGELYHYNKVTLSCAQTINAGRLLLLFLFLFSIYKVLSAYYINLLCRSVMEIGQHTILIQRCEFIKCFAEVKKFDKINKFRKLIYLYIYIVAVSVFLVSLKHINLRCTVLSEILNASHILVFCLTISKPILIILFLIIFLILILILILVFFDFITYLRCVSFLCSIRGKGVRLGLIKVILCQMKYVWGLLGYQHQLLHILKYYERL